MILMSGVRVGGVFLHSVSGKLESIISTSQGRRLLSLLLHHLTDLQLLLIYEELMTVREEGVSPMIVRLAAGVDSQGDVLESVLKRMDTDMMKRLLDIFRDYRDTVIPTESGRMWIRKLSLVINKQ